MSRKYDIDTKVLKEGNTIHTMQEQDIDPTLESVKHLKKVDGGKKQHGYHAARIPMIALLQWGLEDAGDQLAYLQGKHNRDPELAKKLAIRMNSNEFQNLRVWEGTIGSSDFLKEGNKFK